MFNCFVVKHFGNKSEVMITINNFNYKIKINVKVK